jgi:hypothetical protein
MKSQKVLLVMKDLSMLTDGLLGKVTFCGPRAWKELIWIYSSKTNEEVKKAGTIMEGRE